MYVRTSVRNLTRRPFTRAVQRRSAPGPLRSQLASALSLARPDASDLRHARNRPIPDANAVTPCLNPSGSPRIPARRAPNAPRPGRNRRGLFPGAARPSPRAHRLVTSMLHRARNSPIPGSDSRRQTRLGAVQASTRARPPTNRRRAARSRGSSAAMRHRPTPRGRGSALKVLRSLLNASARPRTLTVPHTEHKQCSPHRSR